MKFWCKCVEPVMDDFHFLNKEFRTDARSYESAAKQHVLMNIRTAASHLDKVLVEVSHYDNKPRRFWVKLEATVLERVK